ncbi:hypothetical protein CRE_01495 [Caenorhabditis remanei]|uniref:Rab-GAP TBC domain-containing protein n=1 Tax=Caenorhabditis remanei TaxID=31234 RepID=E3NSM6_CAERE|nr:hypothetical protein CRE_01495 [Caenorhabditis remanei]
MSNFINQITDAHSASPKAASGTEEQETSGRNGERILCEVMNRIRSGISGVSGEGLNRYEKSPDTVNVDAWENPDFEVYTNLDRFGFVLKKGDKTDERTDAQKRRIIRELSREKKWLKMTEVRKSGGPLKNMEDRIWKGVPEKLRIVFWPRLLGVERMKLDNFCVIFILY